MRRFFALAVIGIYFLCLTPTCRAEAKSLFDGKTLDGWEGDIKNTWRIEDGAIVGGSLDRVVPHNEF
ncbi:MAG TPA: family 16 glycoside hydrolase, partial [Bryobacteraceae bacterium]